MIRKQSENLNLVDSLLEIKGKVDYRKEVSERQPEMKQAKKVTEDRSWAVQKPAEGTKYNNPIARSGNSVRSARCASEGGLSDIGGPSKHVNVSGKNSIWDSDVLSNIANTLSSKEATRIEKESSSILRKKKQEEYKQSMSSKLGEEDDEELSKKASSISPVAGVASGKGFIPANKISMFDTNSNFDRLTALTERVSPKVEINKEVIVEPKKVSKAMSSKDLSSKFIDSIVNQPEEKVSTSIHDSAVERLYKVLAERNKE
mgnify:FL=1